ncbi:PEP-CTERM system TPR-repeat protein PrsT [Psychrosphaera ytuae]|uniref:PEP-CTERM system TPR-repeat protein PrsT n=1 Tax=Psychrosphaera ytuae TaxID=2820710 RepID=A0A975D9P1_9GAMM|nr:XrtA/PEP-CTERM system TPR-repeat protein PrsT [Psychrosphaera ytuae]QTH63170.1 PEP-CTERM system TPR-repeat protein PrsT [Psychrosphaera ytuae]
MWDRLFSQVDIKIKLILLLGAIIPVHVLAIDSDYEKALQAYYQGDLQESFIHLKNTLKDDPRNLPAKVLLGKILTENGEFTPAFNIFQEALNQKADINLILEEYTSVLLFLGKYQDVIDINYSLLKTDALRFELLLAKGNAYNQLSLTQLAVDEFKKAIQLLPKNTRAMNALASMYIQQKRLDEANGLINDSLKISPNEPRTIHLFGQLQGQLGDKKAELEAFQKAVTIDNSDPFINRSLVGALIKNGMYADALTLAEEIIEQTPNDPRMKVLMSWLLSMNEKEELSKQLLEDVVTSLSLYDEESFINDPSLILINAISLINQQNWEAAQKELLKYLELTPNDVQAIHFLSEVYIQKGEFRESIDLLENHYSLVIKNKPLGFKLLNLYKENSTTYEFSRLLDQLYSEFPQDPSIALQQASLLSKRGRVRDAKEVLDSLPDESKRTQAYQLANGIIFLENGNLERAEDISKSLLENPDPSAEVHGFAGAVKIKRQSPAEAEVLLRKSLEQNPNAFEVRFNLATALRMQQKLTDAIQIIESLVAEKPENVSVKLIHAQTLSELGKKREAISVLESIEKAKLTDSSALLLFGLYNELNNFDGALKVVEILNNNSLYNRQFMFMKVETLVRLNRLDEAKKQLGILYGLAEDDGRLLYNVASWQRKIADYEGAELTHQKLSRLIPDNILVKTEYVRFLLSKGELDKAQILASNLIKESNGNANAYHVLGDVYLAQQQLTNASKQYWRAIEADSDFDLVVLKLVDLAKLGHDYAKTIKLLESKLDRDPQKLWVKQILADLYFSAGESKKADKYYSDLILLPSFNGNALIYNNLAILQLDYSPKLGLETAKTASELQPNNANIIDTLAWAHAMNGDYGQSLQLLRNAFAMDSSNLEIRYHLAFVLTELDRLVEAKIELDAILNSNPNDDLREKAMSLQARING